MIGSILAALAPIVLPELIKTFVPMAEQYKQGKISEAELRAGLSREGMATFATIETSHADSIARTQTAFFGALQVSPTVQRVWAAVTLSQLAVLIWHQVGIPALTWLSGIPYPSSGTTVEWAYLLIAAALGLGATTLRAGPAGSGGIVGAIKSLFK